MKIMHVVSSPAAGGAEVFVRDLSYQQSLTGHSIVIVFLSSAAEIGRDLKFEEQLLADLDAKCIEYDFVGSNARKSPIRSVFKLLALARKYQPAIIHCHLSYAAVYSVLLAKYKLVFTQHNYVLKQPNFFFKYLDIYFDATIGISDLCHQKLKSVVKNNVVRIDNGVDPARLVKKSPSKRNSPIRISCVGILSEQKNYPLLIDAVATLRDLDIHVSIAGEGPLMNDIKQCISDRHLEDKVSLLGNISNVEQLLGNSDIYVMCSAWEGLPIALIEATLSGLPVVVTDVGGCAEVVERVRNGYVVKSNDAQGLANAIRKLVDSEQLRKEFSTSALQNSSDYTIEKSATSHLQLYRELLSEVH